ncbi:MAG: hypothetical protein CVU84_07440 [Firmicutes bacterium HGW-Firmicutes-1]|nr:MAG: hypothetical protein CVU84_07440 [Firmicutes bacterium HGW-Firmicutes-1]
MKNNKIQISNNKTLKLTNVLIKEVNIKESESFEKEVFLMENYFKNKGAQPNGPIIQYTTIETNDLQEPKIIYKLLRQSNTYLHNVEKPFKMEAQIKVKNCMYSRYVGAEKKLKFAYDKINLTAFEEDIPLKGDSYTIFVAQNDDEIIVDIFMERSDNE